MSRSARRPPATPATRALEATGTPWTGHVYTHDPASVSFGLEAADALDVPPSHVFKTLLADVDGAIVVAVVPVESRLDLGALARAVGGKRAVMADPAVAERRTGYVLGGISPLGQKNTHRTVLDSSVTVLDTLFVSGGRRGFEIELAPADLLALTGGMTASISTS
ncbi:Cys-tRNA(Pro) deacylase [Labedella populi]|uniref:Cys-tRNA(Pro)/Cys-tRNA(Cys) deacylase n=1 Tax=Labedella populi TaxID=2498850 RepID=A0A444QAT1_9MICO|nr:Cys-tRNA(Pro) deacylase [Labedella populi]RWZ61167.1 Cys-tRNA(Pro) deacylase [Labedella populi]